jgi:DNA-3-methyladenine glycosylase
VGRRVARSFLARPSTGVAPELLGHVLVRRTPEGTVLRARIVETEAYAEGDPASHSFRGVTPRTAVMFGRAGRLYVYFTYGMHWCMNVVTGPDGEGSAVLLRAGEPLEGLDEMRRRRGRDAVRELCAGPARWAQAFGVDGTLNGADLVRGTQIWIERGETVPATAMEVTTRIGVRVGTDRPWRFAELASPFVSRGRPVALSPRRARTRRP